MSGELGRNGGREKFARVATLGARPVSPAPVSMMPGNAAQIDTYGVDNHEYLVSKSRYHNGR